MSFENNELILVSKCCPFLVVSMYKNQDLDEQNLTRKER